MELLYRNLMEGEGSNGKAFVYSQFRTLEGIGLFTRVLDTHGFEVLPYDRITASNIGTYADGRLRYVVYSGEEDLEVRNHLKWIYNHPLNLHGEICKVLLGTAAAAEGLTLIAVRQVHILEPYWNRVREQQLKGRARRICSHFGLPKDERNIFVYQYLMVLSPKQQERFPEKESTDQAVYRIGGIKQQINEQFLQILKDGAVDCSLNALHNITPDNPIVCFAFDEKETGIAFYPSLGEETIDRLFKINYKQESIDYATFNRYGTDNLAFFDVERGDYRYVYKYAGDPSIIKHEKIRLTVSANKVATVSAIVLYDKVLAQNGNLLVAKKAIVNGRVFLSKVFTVME